MSRSKYSRKTIDRICEQLEEGKSLVLICRDRGMPSRATVYNWLDQDDELAARLLRARELGYHFRAEMAVAAAKASKDPRVAFDAERWYLGKLSNAFREKPLQIGAFVSVGIEDVFAAVQGALDQAAAAIARSGHSTIDVALPGAAGSDHSAGELADLASHGGQGVGQNPDGS